MSGEPSIEKLLRTQAEEDRVRELSLKLLYADSRTAHMLELIELSLDIMLNAAGVPQPTEDGKTVSATVARIFNSTLGCLRQALHGYYQTSFGLMRDLVEIATLLDYFHVHPEKIARWRQVTNVERLQEFSGGHLRKTLDDRDGFVEGKRKSDFQAFSEHAAHLTFPALLMLQASDGTTQWGPHLNESHLRNCLFELARRVTHCSTLVVGLLPAHVEDGDIAAAEKLYADTLRQQELYRGVYGA
jgi:hypothetical protein